MDAYKMEIKDIFDSLKTSSGGLSNEEAKKRLEEYGYNEFPERKKAPAFVLFLNQFKGALIFILLVATVVSGLLGEVLDASVILIIVVLNAFLGFFQERKAERALEALKKIAAPQAVVLRGSETITIPAREIVPGDVIVLKVGDKVPADCRIIEEMNLKADESVLTGESTPVEKGETRIAKDAPIAERTNMLFSGTAIVYGHCKAIAVSTGMKTEFGKIATMLQEKEETTPLQQKMAVLGKHLGLIILVVSSVIFISGAVLGQKPLDIFLTSVALAVAAIPEGLPAVVTITLAVGLQKMATKNAIVRRLPAVETLGSTTVICSDKTGTLTVNEMTVRKIYVNGKMIDVTGEGYNLEGKFLSHKEEIKPTGDIQLLLEAGLFCNDAVIENKIGDPTEIALLVSAAKGGLSNREKYSRIDEIPFESERKMMSVEYSIGSKKFCYTKGAVESVLTRCTDIYKNGLIKKLLPEEKKKIMAINKQFASSALRVLAFAYKELKKERLAEKNLVFIGLQGMIDPPRAEVKQAINQCKSASIKVVMITGDHIETAIAVAKELGLETDNVLTGQQIDSLSDKEFDKVVENVSVYARVSPEHKVHITEALKKKGHIIAMTGDGVNDAPALKKADIGIAMGITGTDVSKEASDMVLTDDNFSSIVSAVEEGRGIFDNIRKFVYYMLSANIGEVLTIFLAILISLAIKIPLVLPLVPVQILWMNLLTDGLPALALGVEPKEPDIMKRKPRNTKENVLTKDSILFLLFVGIIISTGTLFLFYQSLPQGLAHARTIAFTTIVMFQMFLALTMRSKLPLWKVGLFSNKKLLAAIAASIILQLLVIYVPAFDIVFETTELSLGDWIPILLVSSSVLVILEIKKLLKR